jgi:hypothetical protein
MTKFDWEKAERQDKVRRFPLVRDYDSTATGSSPNLSFVAQRPGICETCRQPYSVGDRITVNVNGLLVHSGGCPRKIRGV